MAVALLTVVAVPTISLLALVVLWVFFLLCAGMGQPPPDPYGY